MMNDYGVNERFDNLERKMSALVDELEIVLDKSTPVPVLYDNSDMKRMFNLSDRTLSYWRSNNVIEYIKIGNKVYYTKEAIIELLRSNLVSITTNVSGSDVRCNFKFKNNE